MTFGTVASVVGIAAGVNSLMGGGGGGGGGGSYGQQVQQQADPFAPYRSNLGAMYSAALSQGGTADVTQMPGWSQYKSGVMDPAMEATKRSMAASGQLQSGAEQLALQDVGQRGYYGFMTDYLNRLAQGSGATNNPATAAGMGLGAQQSYQQAQMQGLGGIMQNLKGLYSGSSGYGYTGSGSYTDSAVYTGAASSPTTYLYDDPMQLYGGM